MCALYPQQKTGKSQFVRKYSSTCERACITLNYKLIKYTNDHFTTTHIERPTDRPTYGKVMDMKQSREPAQFGTVVYGRNLVAHCVCKSTGTSIFCVRVCVCWGLFSLWSLGVGGTHMCWLAGRCTRGSAGFVCFAWDARVHT